MRRRSALFAIPVAAYAAVAGSQTAGTLGMVYLRRVRALLEKIRTHQSAAMLEAAYRIAGTIARGNTCYALWDMGHSNMFDLWPDRPGVPDFMTPGIPDAVRPGDLILTNNWNEKLAGLKDQGAFIIAGPRPWGGDNIGTELLKPEFHSRTIRPLADLWIEVYATSHGAILEVPGETAPMGPVSGVVGMLTYWMIVADAARLLVREGIGYNVSGPPCGDRNATALLDLPLGEAYYLTAMEQHSAIDDCYDEVRAIADMAVHSALTGGRVYVYSRWPDNLCAEATVRRGGLGLTFGVSGPPDNLVLMDDPLQQGRADLTFAPTEKDTIIMGIGMPADPDDLASLDQFRESGAMIAAIGPDTVCGDIPSGRSVPAEADVYAGSMTDACGLFFLPRIDRPVAPTSGFIMNQLFWAVCCEIAGDIYTRTGEAPGIYLSGALRGGMEKLNEVKRLYRERGY